MFKRLIFIGCVAAQNFIWYNVAGKKSANNFSLKISLRHRRREIFCCTWCAVFRGTGYRYSLVYQAEIRMRTGSLWLCGIKYIDS